MLQFTTRVISTGVYNWRSGNRICFERPQALEAAIADLLRKAEEKNGYLTLRLELPHQPKTRPQQNHLRGHVRQLCDYTGYDMQEMMDIVKADTPDWPVEYYTFHGKKRMRYASEADVSKPVESAAVELCHRYAAELGVTLVEGN